MTVVDHDYTMEQELPDLPPLKENNATQRVVTGEKPPPSVILANDTDDKPSDVRLYIVFILYLDRGLGVRNVQCGDLVKILPGYLHLVPFMVTKQRSCLIQADSTFRQIQTRKIKKVYLNLPIFSLHFG